MTHITEEQRRAERAYFADSQFSEEPYLGSDACKEIARKAAEQQSAYTNWINTRHAYRETPEALQIQADDMHACGRAAYIAAAVVALATLAVGIATLFIGA